MSFCEHEWTLLCIFEILQNFPPMLHDFFLGKKTKPASKNRFFFFFRDQRCLGVKPQKNEGGLHSRPADSLKTVGMVGDQHRWDVAVARFEGVLLETMILIKLVLKVMVIHYHPTCFNMFSELGWTLTMTLWHFQCRDGNRINME